MNLAHLHLLITHLPIYGSLLGIIVLVYGIVSRSVQTRQAAYLVLLLSSVGAIIAFSTGESAEETVEHITGINKQLIETHENAAKITLTAMILTGISSLLGLFVSNKKNRYAKIILSIALIISSIGFISAAYTGYLGGQIRHTEIHDHVKQTI